MLLTAKKLLVGKLRDIDHGIRGLLWGFGRKVGTVGERAFDVVCRSLMTVPGLGPATALTFRSAIDGAV